MAIETRKLVLGKRCLVVSCLAIGCSQGAGTSGDEASETREVGIQEAETVLGFQSRDAWLAQGRGVRSNFGRIDGKDALELAIEDRVTLTSAAFAFAKTPNKVEFSIRAPESSAAKNHGGSADAYLTCLSREVARERVGTVELGTVTPGRFQRVALAVPERLQSALAGGCEQFQIELIINVGSARGTYVLDDLELRAQTPAIARDSTPLCGMQEPKDLFRGAVELPEGFMDYQAWMATPVLREELAGLEAALEPHEDTVLGSTIDHVNKQIVVVVDPQEYAKGRVLAELQAKDIALPLRIQPACNPVAAVREAGRYLLARPATPETPSTIGHPDVARGQFVITVDPGTPASALEIESIQRVTAGLSPLPADVIYQPSLTNRTFMNDLKQRFAGAVDVRWGRAGRTGRLNDGQPHFGAAGIGEANFNFCTSGFIAVKNGFRGAVTAAHCYDFGDGPESNLWVTSGPKLYGITGIAAAYPQFDMMRIDPGGQQFTNTIHTDPGTLTRLQIGKRNPVVGDVLCVSGSVTRAKCSITVLDHGCVATGPGGNTGGLTTGRRTGVLIAQAGDSGAPVYQQSGASGAIINGLLVGAAFDRICFHRVSTVETQLGVTVAL